MMLTAYYDRKGVAIAYTEDDEHIYLFNGDPVAYFDGTSVYNFKGKHLGWHQDGWLWDNDGAAVLFTERARGGPTCPMRQSLPFQGSKRFLPSKSFRESRPFTPRFQINWSRLAGEDFFTQ